jgi:hypothetical protein
MTDDHERDDRRAGRDRPTARQVLHAATGDRDAEAEALADRDDEIDEREARIAVQRAHGEAGSDAPQTPSDIADPADAEQVRRERGS